MREIDLLDGAETSEVKKELGDVWRRLLDDPGMRAELQRDGINVKLLESLDTASRDLHPEDEPNRGPFEVDRQGAGITGGEAVLILVAGAIGQKLLEKLGDKLAKEAVDWLVDDFWPNVIWPELRDRLEKIRGKKITHHGD